MEKPKAGVCVCSVKRSPRRRWTVRQSKARTPKVIGRSMRPVLAHLDPSPRLKCSTNMNILSQASYESGCVEVRCIRASNDGCRLLTRPTRPSGVPRVAPHATRSLTRIQPAQPILPTTRINPGPSVVLHFVHPTALSSDDSDSNPPTSRCPLRADLPVLDRRRPVLLDPLFVFPHGPVGPALGRRFRCLCEIHLERPSGV